MTFIYSIPVHWIWDKNGWLKFTEFKHQNDKEEEFKTRDFAGAGLVHLVSLTSLFLNLGFVFLGFTKFEHQNDKEGEFKSRPSPFG